MGGRLASATKRAAIYARRSDESGDRDRSLPDQIAACRRLAVERGWTVVPDWIVTELGSAAGNAEEDRPEFMRLVRAAQSKPRPFDVVVCLDVSRFSRGEPDEAAHWRYLLRRAGVEVAFVVDGDALSGKFGAVNATLLQHAARDHSEKTGYKVALAFAASVAGGRWPWGRAPYGYALLREPIATGSGRKKRTLGSCSTASTPKRSRSFVGSSPATSRASRPSRSPRS